MARAIPGLLTPVDTDDSRAIGRISGGFRCLKKAIEQPPDRRNSNGEVGGIEVVHRS